MKTTFLIFHILFSIILFGQNISKESFVNEVYRAQVNIEINDYLLLDNCIPLRISKFTKSAMEKDFLPFISKEQLESMVESATQDTLELKWINSDLINSICIDEDSTKVVITGKILYIKENWSDKRIQKEREKLDRDRDLIPMREKKYFVFSRPIYDESGKFAMIYMSSSSGYLYGHRCIYLFNKTRNGWTEISSTYCSLS